MYGKSTRSILKNLIDCYEDIIEMINKDSLIMPYSLLSIPITLNLLKIIIASVISIISPVLIKIIVTWFYLLNFIKIFNLRSKVL